MSEDKNHEASARAQSVACKTSALASPPSEPRERELWLQHAAGYLLFERIRAAGLATTAPDASAEVRDAVALALDATMYALMMQVEGVAIGLMSEAGRIELTLGVELTKEDEVVERIDLRHGDGLCMGFHFWVDGDYGENPIVAGE